MTPTLRAAGGAVAVSALLVVGLAGGLVLAPGSLAVLLAAAGVAVVVGAAVLTSPALATALLLVTAFLRLALPTGPLPTDLFVLAFGGVLVSVVLAWRTSREPAPRVGALGLVVAAYVGWNVVSMVLPHVYDPGYPADGGEIVVWRFVLIGTVMPLVMLLVGITTLSRPGATRVLVLTVLALGAYSALVSILAAHGPGALVWPAYAVENPEWPGRAVGVVYQPVVNGLVLVLGYLTALLVASRPGTPTAARVAAGLVAAACCYGVYLTYTRSAWLCLAVVVLLGAVVARGWRTGFVVTGALGLAGAAVNWATLVSGDRQAGGVTSSNEVFDRLNINATAWWAALAEPVTGWGIGRFPAVNTYHHQQFSPGVPWERGFGLASHLDLLGVAAELGLVGAVLWLAVTGLVGLGLVRAVRRLPVATDCDGLAGRDLATTALLGFVAWLVTGLTVDQRLFDVSNLAVLALAGAAIGLSRRSGPAPVPAVPAVPRAVTA